MFTSSYINQSPVLWPSVPSHVFNTSEKNVYDKLKKKDLFACPSHTSQQTSLVHRCVFLMTTLMRYNSQTIKYTLIGA